MRTLKTKLASRKFLAALAGVITGLAMVFGVDEAVVSTVAGAVVSVGSIAVYIITEGKVDAAHAVKAAESVLQAVEAVAEEKNGVAATSGQTDSV